MLIYRFTTGRCLQALGKSEVMNRARAVRSRGTYRKIEPGDDDPKVRRVVFLLTALPPWSLAS